MKKTTAFAFALFLAVFALFLFSCGGGGGGGAVNEMFTISYNANGADSGTAPASQHGDEETSQSIQANSGNLAKSGYLFDGWNTTADGSGTTYAPGFSYKGNDLTLYAKWAAIFEVEEIGGGSPAPAIDGVQKAPGSSALKILGLTAKGRTLTAIDIPSAIDGNSVTAIGSGAFRDCSFITNITIPATVTSIEGNAFAGCSNLTSLMLLGTVPPVFVASALDSCPATVYVPASAVAAYQAADGWDANPGIIDGYSSEPHTVTFDSQGANTPASPATKTTVPPAITLGSLPTPPELTDHIFDGWNTAADGSGAAFTASTVVTADITVYAQWKYNYTVTFNDQGATTHVNPETKDVTEPATTVDTLPTTQPEKTDYFFGGWYTGPNGAGEEFTASTVVTESITVYAKWVSRYSSTVGNRTGASIGDIVLSNKATITHVNYTAYASALSSEGLAPVGVVAYKGGDEVEDLYKPFLGGTAKVGTSGKIYMVGLLQSGSDLVWAPTDTTGYNTIFSTSYNDGSGNWQVVRTADSTGTATAELIATNYPAFNYANSYTATGYTSGWYLPALAELKRIALNSDAINDGFSAITGAGGTAIALTENNYWSSSQFDNGAPYKTHAGHVDFSQDKSLFTYKYYTYYVRVVRALDD